jgi:hypothetical protein
MMGKNIISKFLKNHFLKKMKIILSMWKLTLGYLVFLHFDLSYFISA